MLPTILIALAAILVLFVIVTTRPPTYRIERSSTISAPPSEIFPHLNDLRKSNVWSPWVKLDPAAKQTFEGPASGVGAVGAWDGNKNVGAGRQTIIESRPNELVRLRLDFERPFKCTSTAEFTLKPTRNETVVTWSLAGENNFVSRAFCLFMNQDKMVGGQFEKGLADLKALTEPAVAGARA